MDASKKGGGRGTVVSIFGFTPHRISSAIVYTRELSRQLAERDWKSVLCFLEMPTEPVRRFLDGPNVTFDVVQDSPRLCWVASRQVFEILRRYRPRILHLHFTSFLNPYSWMARLMGTEQVYFTDHASPPEDYIPAPAPLWKRLTMRVIHFPLTGVISVSKFGYRNFSERGLIPKGRFHQIYNGIDLDYVTPGAGNGDEFRRRYQIPPGRVVITQVSWLIPEKGVDDLLIAGSEVVGAESRTHFVLVGEGAHQSALEQLTRKLGIASHVTFTGRLDDLLKEGLFAASDIVCQMSRWQEVFGATNAEAMACGRPIIATRVGGIPEIVEDGVTGFLVDRRDTRAMAERILDLVRDPDLRRRMGEAGREVCRAKFDLKKTVAQLVDIYMMPARALH